jgi:UDPglucose 6-dehydrogenase
MKSLPQRIVCIGAGYVGGPTMAVIADRCPAIDVTVLDVNLERINAWKSPVLPVFEPGLDSIVKRARQRNLHFVHQSEGAAALARADLIFISVQTPTKIKGKGAGKASDLKYVEAAARLIARHARGHTVVVEKSTMPVRAADTIKRILSRTKAGATFSVLSNPEFLAEGTAIRDLEKPDRVLIGGDNARAIQSLVQVYRHWVPAEKIITTGLWSAELAKLTANAFLAQRVSSINSISALCEKTEADVDEVAQVIGLDSRIGPKFLKASVGFGGSCFKKDLLSLVYLSEHYGLPEVAAYWTQVYAINEWQKERFTQAIHRQTRSGKVAVLGLAFKKDTNDFRESAALEVCRGLLKRGYTVHAYDPGVDFQKFAETLGHPPRLHQASSALAAMQGAKAVAVLTEWDEFRRVNWRLARKALHKSAIVFDGRAVVDAAAAKKAGFEVRTLGHRRPL